MWRYWFSGASLVLCVASANASEQKVDDQDFAKYGSSIKDEHQQAFRQFKRLQKNAQKTESETTDEFERRSKEVQSKFSDITNRNFSFVLSNEILYRKPKRLWGNENIRYSADEKIIKVRLGRDDTSTHSAGFTVYRLDEVSTPQGAYIGTNSYGAKLRVVKEKVYWPCVALSKSLDQELTFAYPGKFTQAQKSKLSIAIVGKPLDPFIFESKTYHDPKFDSPYDQVYIEECVALSPSILILFDATTRKALSAINLGTESESGK